MILPVSNVNNQCSRKIAFTSLEEVGGGNYISKSELEALSSAVTGLLNSDDELFANNHLQKSLKESHSNSFLARIKNAIKLIIK